ncbi:MAG: hypothetical protein GY754_35440 [bacterium]|nr:hypothetical protein [bacterium]
MKSRLIPAQLFLVISLILLCCSSLFAEGIFLKDGSIIEGKIINETDTRMTIRLPNKKTVKLKRRKVLRVTYNTLYKKISYIKKKDRSVLEVYIVNEDNDSYTLREKLNSPAEFQLDRDDVVSVSSEKYVSKSTYYAWGFLPGAAQLYADKTTRGWVFLGGSLVSYGLLGFTAWFYIDKKSAYQDVPRGSAASLFDDAYSEYQTASYLFIGALGLSVALYIANWVDVIFFSAPDFDSLEKKQEKTAYFDISIDQVPYASVPDVRFGFKMGFRF